MFKMPSRSTLEKEAYSLLQQFFDHKELDDEETEVEVQEVSTSTAKTYAESLQEDIDTETAPKTADNFLHTKNSLQTEMKLFETTYERGESLKNLQLMLKNIAPTSHACEQSFSLSGNIITKSRSRLSDGSIDDLCFEKSFFLKKHLYM